MTITRGWLDHAEGSVLVEFGRTRVLCAASFTEGVPRWRRGSGLGWVTAEYAMLPRARTPADRESVKGRLGGRTQEISRLVGRSLRAVVDYKALGENTIVLDCDVLQADGGTRTAAITGAYVALADAVAWPRAAAGRGRALLGSVAAVWVGVVDGSPLLDLCYEEDVRADRHERGLTGDGRFVEVQGTAEGEPFDRALLGRLLDLAVEGCAELTGCRASPDRRRAGGRAGSGDRRPLVSRQPERAKVPSCAGSSRDSGGAQVGLAGLDGSPARPRWRDRRDVRGERAAQGARGRGYTGLPAVADDSGLCVDALNGMPGVLSARWSGRTATTGRTWSWCWTSWPTSPTSGSARSSSAPPRWRAGRRTARGS